MAARTVVDVVLGEAAPGDYQDMLAIASVIANRALATGASMDEVISAAGQFDAYGRELPPGVEEYREQALQAMREVLDQGPVTTAMFYATPAAVANLPDGLELATETTGHQYFEDPQGRAIAVGDRYVEPDMAEVLDAFAPDDAPGEISSNEAFAGLLGPSAGPGDVSLNDYAMNQPLGHEMPGLDPGMQEVVDGMAKSGALDPSRITSGYRDPEHNARVGGATQSQHLHGNAIDIRARDMTADQRAGLLNTARGLGVTGIGAYGTGNLHVDKGRTRTWGPGSPGTRGPVSGLLAGDLPPLAGAPVATEARPLGAEPTASPQTLASLPNATPEPLSYDPLSSASSFRPPTPDAIETAVFDRGVVASYQPPQAPASLPPGAAAPGITPGPMPAPVPPPAPAIPEPAMPAWTEPPRTIANAPGLFAADPNRPNPAEAASSDDGIGSAMDVYNGVANIGRATNGDIIQRDPQTGEMTRQSQKYGYTESIRQDGTFRGFANAPEGSPAANFQGAVHGVLPGPETIGTIGGAGVGGLLAGPAGAAIGGIAGRTAAGKKFDLKETVAEIGGSVLGGTLLGPPGAAIGATIGRRIGSGKGLLSDDDDMPGGILGTIFGGILGSLKQAGGGMGSGQSWMSGGGNSESGGGYNSYSSYSSNGAPLPPSRPGGGWGWGGGGGGGVTRDGSDR